MYNIIATVMLETVKLTVALHLFGGHRGVQRERNKEREEGEGGGGGEERETDRQREKQTETENYVSHADPCDL